MPEGGCDPSGSLCSWQDMWGGQVPALGMPAPEGLTLCKAGAMHEELL